MVAAKHSKIMTIKQDQQNLTKSNKICTNQIKPNKIQTHVKYFKIKPHNGNKIKSNNIYKNRTHQTNSSKSHYNMQYVKQIKNKTTSNTICKKKLTKSSTIIQQPIKSMNINNSQTQLTKSNNIHTNKNKSKELN